MPWPFAKVAFPFQISQTALKGRGLLGVSVSAHAHRSWCPQPDFIGIPHGRLASSYAEFLSSKIVPAAWLPNAVPPARGRDVLRRRTTSYRPSLVTSSRPVVPRMASAAVMGIAEEGAMDIDFEDALGEALERAAGELDPHEESDSKLRGRQ